jgi:hypothetical protein
MFKIRGVYWQKTEAGELQAMRPAIFQQGEYEHTSKTTAAPKGQSDANSTYTSWYCACG